MAFSTLVFLREFHVNFTQWHEKRSYASVTPWLLVVDQPGLEPGTSRLWVCCSNQLSYKSRNQFLIRGAKVIKKWEINRYLQIFLKKKIRSSEVGGGLLTLWHNIQLKLSRIQIASANLRKLFVKAFYRCGKI